MHLTISLLNFFCSNHTSISSYQTKTILNLPRILDWFSLKRLLGKGESYMCPHAQVADKTSLLLFYVTCMLIAVITLSIVGKLGSYDTKITAGDWCGISVPLRFRSFCLCNGFHTYTHVRPASCKTVRGTLSEHNLQSTSSKCSEMTVCM